jgi:ankyrin repeat protein
MPSKEMSDAEFVQECSAEEYQELLGQAKSLSREEAGIELRDCARYGEVDAVRAILECHDGIIDAVDESESSALHKACANGHLSTVQFLLSNGANYAPNTSGNTPLHWAAASGHEAVVKAILSCSRIEVDVLQKNAFGRSALTEGFSSQNTPLIGLLLEHDSATEERLLSTKKDLPLKPSSSSKNPNNQEINEDQKDEKPSVIHEFNFQGGLSSGSIEGQDEKAAQTLLIRELVSPPLPSPWIIETMSCFVLLT